MGRGDLTDQQWQQLQPLLPLQKPTTGRPAKDHRTIINGSLWVLRTGASWFYRWRQDGLWDRLLRAVQQQSNIQRKVNWELHYVDGTARL